jgi:hyperosmotically inducible protein
MHRFEGSRVLACLAALCIGCAVILAQGCAALAVGGAAAGGYYVGKDERSIGQITEDASITAQVNAKFVADDLVKTFDIDVDTYRGKVYLFGHVDSVAARQRAIALAQSVKGVSAVVSELHVVN